jgi:hypothetical protein
MLPKAISDIESLIRLREEALFYHDWYNSTILRNELETQGVFYNDDTEKYFVLKQNGEKILWNEYRKLAISSISLFNRTGITKPQPLRSRFDELPIAEFSF